MENATDALKIAFAVLVFVMALTIAITMFSQLNRTSKILISATDTTNYYQYSLSDASKTFREVGLETIIPTLYKYYKEQYTVVFLDGRNPNDVKPLTLYESQINKEFWGNRKLGESDEEDDEEDDDKFIAKYTICGNTYSIIEDGIFFFDLDNETLRQEPWTVGNNIKRNLDCFLSGNPYRYYSSYSKYANNPVVTDENGNLTNTEYNYDNDYLDGGFIKQFQTWKDNGYKFKEMLGEYTFTTTSEDGGHHSVTQKKRVIIYKLVNKED